MPYEVIVIKPDGEITKTRQVKKPEYEEIRKTVGGLIQQVPHLMKLEDHKRGTAFVNEEGIIHNLPFNAKATEIWLENLGKGPFSYPPHLYGNMIYYAKIK